MGFRIIYADEAHEKPFSELAKIICDQVGKKKAYLTFDIDCLDPSAAPGTGTPIPGGLTYHQAASIIRRLQPINFVGMDVVEVSPPYDHAEITSLAASSLVMEYLCLRAAQKVRDRHGDAEISEPRFCWAAGNEGVNRYPMPGL